MEGVLPNQEFIKRNPLFLKDLSKRGCLRELDFSGLQHAGSVNSSKSANSPGVDVDSHIGLSNLERVRNGARNANLNHLLNDSGMGLSVTHGEQGFVMFGLQLNRYPDVLGHV